MSDTLPTPPPIDSRLAWGAALKWGLQTAIARGARSITCVDADFADWPLNDGALLQEVGFWLRLPQRRLVLLAAGFEEVPRRHPRFMAWRRDWVHAIHGLQAPEELVPSLPRALLDDASLSVELLDSVHWRGRASLEARTAHLLRERVDAILQRATPAFALNTLGL